MMHHFSESEEEEDCVEDYAAGNSHNDMEYYAPIEISQPMEEAAAEDCYDDDGIAIDEGEYVEEDYMFDDDEILMNAELAMAPEDMRMEIDSYEEEDCEEDY